MLTQRQLVRFNYSLSLSWIRTITPEESKTLILGAIRELLGLLEIDQQVVLGTFNAAIQDLETCVFRRDRHSWSVSIYGLHPRLGLFMLDSTDWCITVTNPQKRVFLGQDRESDQIGTAFREIEINAKDYVVAIGNHQVTHVVAKSNRFYDSLMFSFALEKLLESTSNDIDLVLVKGMHFRRMHSLLDNSKVVSVTTLDNYELLQRILQRPYDCWIFCLRFPVDEWKQQYSTYFGRFVRQQRLPRLKSSLQTNDFTILISFELEKRRWIEQEAGYGLLLGQLASYFGTISVLVNGLTAPADSTLSPSFSQVIDEERSITERIRRSLNDRILFHDLGGMTLEQKIHAVSSVNFFVTPAGSAGVVPAYLGVPGVVYGTAEFIKDNSWLFEGYPFVTVYDTSLVTTLVEDKSIMKYDWAKFDASSKSYSIEPYAFATFASGQAIRQQELERDLE